MRVGIAADHGGFALKEQVMQALGGTDYRTMDFGAHRLEPDRDYPDFVSPLAKVAALAQDATSKGKEHPD